MGGRRADDRLAAGELARRPGRMLTIGGPPFQVFWQASVWCLMWRVDWDAQHVVRLTHGFRVHTHETE
jgi:hypothetical protein